MESGSSWSPADVEDVYLVFVLGVGVEVVSRCGVF
jgi:hypothetical protein